MDATCNVQDSIHVFHLVHNMCLGFWVHISLSEGSCLLGYYSPKAMMVSTNNFFVK